MSKFYLKYENTPHCVGESPTEGATCSCQFSQPTQNHREPSAVAKQHEGSHLFSKRKQRNKPTSISRVLFQRFPNDKAIKRAIAFSITIKSYIYCGVARNFTYKQLAQLASVSESTARRCVKKLIETGFAKRIGKRKQHLQFLSIDKKFDNIKLNKRFNFKTFHDTMDGLNAAAILEAQQRKEYIVQQALTTEDPKASMIKVKKALKVMKGHGLCSAKDFSDNGTSQDRICKENKISKSTLQKAVKYAEKKDIFHRHKRFLVLEAFNDQIEALHALNTMKKESDSDWVKEIFLNAARKMKEEYNAAKARLFSTKIAEKVERAFVIFDNALAKWIIAFQTTMEYTKHKTKNGCFYYSNTTLMEEYASVIYP